ncbi:oligosaccharide flippase family protein [Marinobacter shengliensis]|uniref:oligosaccharide flippase family protein n=1 Tax=Marinobacter shengliensis TaxID=1389223 RepID=UPI001108B8D2|nr:oligosaccharide flippase family protein [Marinobacter shengliensis]
MLFRHTLYYFIARGLPGLVNFAALAVFTRLLAPEEFGRYALVVVGVGLANVIFFQWLRLVLGRFYQVNRHSPEQFLGGILALFLWVAVPITGTGLVLALLWPDPIWRQLLLLAVILLLTQAWFEMSLSLAQASVRPGWYGRLSGAKALVSILVGGTLAWIGWGSSAPIVGLILAHIIALLVFSAHAWRGLSLRLPARDVLYGQLRYGLPLTITFALSWVVSGSDRLIIAWIMDEQAVGEYAAGYDLVFQTLMLVLTIINTAAYPLAVNALERGGESAAMEQLKQNGQLIFVAAVAGCFGLIALGPQVVEIVIGAEFRSAAMMIFPWVAMAGAVAGIKAFHFDLAFQLGVASHWLVVTGGIAAVVNVGLNLLLIPSFGILGAAWATLAAFVAALVAGALIGRRIFTMPGVTPMVWRALVVGAFAGGFAWAGASAFDGVWSGTMGGLMAGTLAGGFACWLVDVAGVRVMLSKRFRS